MPKEETRWKKWIKTSKMNLKKIKNKWHNKTMNRKNQMNLRNTYNNKSLELHNNYFRRLKSRIK